MRIGALIGLSILIAGQLSSQNIPIKKIDSGFRNDRFHISWGKDKIAAFRYFLPNDPNPIVIEFPTFNVNGKRIKVILDDIRRLAEPSQKRNQVFNLTYEGKLSGHSGKKIQIEFQYAKDNPVLRFRYHLFFGNVDLLTKPVRVDEFTYLRFLAPERVLNEIIFSRFDNRIHATHLSEEIIPARYFEDNQAIMGPMVVAHQKGNSFLVAYEHGSQFGDRFLEFRLQNRGYISLNAVKGNYLTGEQANGFITPWLELAAVYGDEDKLAKNYRDFVLNYLSLNKESRKPYIFYNTWGRQERSHWKGEPYLTTMNLDQTLREIDRAHELGIEVYVIDAGWFNLTGDWNVNTKYFPDTLQLVKRKLNQYGMKLGLWFNPTVAATQSQMYSANMANRMSWNDSLPPPSTIWETPLSSSMCLVSNYWLDFAAKLILLNKTLGVTYFKWDGIGQYGCNDSHHLHGNEKNSKEERSDSYAFQQPLFMSKIIDKVVSQCPDAIFDFDITEPGRCVGLQFLSSGKYFIINNGPYFHNFDLADTWKSPLANGNANIFVSPGPARGWFVRSVLDYDKWIPSNLFLTHYQADGNEASQIINLASLILGQNGIWGEILNLNDTTIELFHKVISKYKLVRADMERATIINTGLPGQSPEIYEKIDSETGKGSIIIFSNGGDVNYISKNKVDSKQWKTGNMNFKIDVKGRALVHAHMNGPSAGIIIFGTN